MLLLQHKHMREQATDRFYVAAAGNFGTVFCDQAYWVSCLAVQ